MLPPAFVSALQMSAQDHMLMNAAVQPFVDTAISKTVNVPADGAAAAQVWAGSGRVQHISRRDSCQRGCGSDQFHYLLILDTIEDVFSIPASGKDTRLTQPHQML